MSARWREAPVTGGAYSDETRAWTVQDTVNWIPEAAERGGGRSSSMLRCAPGAAVFCVPEAAKPAPVRGLHDVEDKLFAVIGTTLWQITTAGVAIPRGTIPGVERVCMAHNQIAGGNQLVIGNGASGYVYNTYTELLAEQITGEGFPGLKACDYVDSYIVGVEPSGRYWFHSALADATRYSALDRYEAESQPDRIVGLIVLHRTVFVLGKRSGEFFYNSGASEGTFQRHAGTEMQIGCASRHTLQQMGSAVFWLGHDGRVYQLNGYQPARISTPPLEQAITACNHEEAFAFTYEDRGHQVYYLTFPDGMTWGFDASTHEWHRRESFGISRWRMNACVRWAAQWVAGDFANGKLYTLDWGMPWEHGEVIERRRVNGVLHDHQNRMTVDAVELVFGTDALGGYKGPGDLTPPQPAGPTLSGNAPDAVNKQAYTYAYTMKPGATPIVAVRVASGALPEGLSLDPKGVLAGTVEVAGLVAGTKRAYPFTIRVTDANGLWASVTDTIIIAAVEVICGTDTSYSGGQAFPNSVHVQLGSQTGLVTLAYATVANPDKFQVWIGGQKVIDTGYHGDTSYQAQLDADLSSRGLPSETITQRPGSESDPADQFANKNYETATFQKTTAETIAEVRVYSPLAGTGWQFHLDCPT
ncbi:putative Ig domain-containing protein [Xylella fastidiosa]|uniref:putative Ig domain-containing protein n=1 Tax=Xylella fastidiosa TaxID=2371 RepID=UPI003AFA9CEF